MMKGDDSFLTSLGVALGRFREALGSNAEFRRFVLLLLGVLVAWSVGLQLAQEASSEWQRSSLLEERFRKFLDVVSQYRALGGASASGMREGRASDPLEAFSGVADRLGMKGRIKDLSASDQGVVVALERLYAEEFMTLLQELDGAGLVVRSAELRTLPEQDGPLFALSLIVGVES